jgi:hypothetical protein
MRHDTMEGMQAAYEQQSKLPYYHRGREGTHFIVFDVKGGEEEWNRVGKVVDGMNRDWREMLPDGSRRVYMKFTDQLSHTEAVSKLAGLSDLFEPDSYGAGLIGERNKFAAGATPAFIRSAERRIDGLEKATDAAKDQMKQALHDLYIGQQPETSPLKNRMMADNTNGASRDTTKMYMNNMEMSNRALVNARSAMRFADVSTNLDAAMTELRAVPGADINDIRTQIGGYVNELYKKQADMQQPLEYSQTIAAMRAATGFWRLGLSPMYMLTVGLQPAQVTLPTLGAKYGYADAAMSMGRNTALAWGMLKSAMTTGWMSSKGDSLFNRLAKTSDITLEASKLRNKDGTPVLSERQLDLMDHLMDTGLINFGITQQMLRMDPNDKSIGARAARIAQTIPHYIEMSNRIVSALSGYELHYNKLAAGKDLSPAEMNRIHEEAKREAITTIRESDGDHSQVNVARQLGQRGILKQTTPLVVGFGQWSIQMSEFLARQFQRSISAKSTKEERIESLKIMGGVSAMTGAMAGALGLPFMNVATGVYNAVMQILQDEGETPPNAEEMFRHGVRSLLSTVSDDKESVNKMEEIFSRGLPRAAGFDMSSRAGFQDLLPFTGLLTNRARISDRLKDGSFDFMGPAFGAAAGVVTGLQAYKDGDYVKGNNEALPVFARNIAKAMRMSQYGYETTGSNNQIPIPVTNWDTFMQGMGATSGVKAEYNEQAYAQQVNQKILMDRHQVVMNEILRNAEHGDYQAMQQSMTRSIQFGLQQPQFRQFDVPGAMVGRAMQRAIGGMPDVGGLLLNKSQLPYYMMRQGMIPPPQQVQ